MIVGTVKDSRRIKNVIEIPMQQSVHCTMYKLQTQTNKLNRFTFWARLKFCKKRRSALFRIADLDVDSEMGMCISGSTKHFIGRVKSFSRLKTASRCHRVRWPDDS